MTDRSAELLAVAEQAGQLASPESEVSDVLAVVDAAAVDTARSWSKSNLGYQANVYYSGFRTPPPGHMFSREWGFLGTFQGSVGEWHPYEADAVVAHIVDLAGHPDLTAAKAASDSVRPQVEELIQRARSIAARVPLPHDAYLKENLEALQHVSLPNVGKLAASLMNTSGQFVARDMQALEEGWQTAGHQKVLAEGMYIRSPYRSAKELAKLCERLGRHLESDESAAAPVVVQLGSTIFIGHGGASSEYLRLGVWLTDLGLEWEVFDRKATAGVSTKERLAEMLDNAQLALLLMTPEDENALGEMQARANVIHEVGLFQGRLGFTKAIVLLEEGCAAFSNIEGLGQIRYPKGNVKAAFEEIRQVLLRERIIS